MEQNDENVKMLNLCVWLQEHINLCKSLSICNDKNLGELFIKIINNNVEYGKSLLNEYFINKRGIKKMCIPISCDLSSMNYIIFYKNNSLFI